VVGIATCGGASGGEAGGGWNGGEREKNYRNGGRGAGFWPILDRLSLPSCHEMQPYL